MAREAEGDFTSGTCNHLRFSLHSECDDDFEFFGEWYAEGFMRLVEEAREKDADGEMDIFDSWARFSIQTLIKQYYTYGMMICYITPGRSGDIMRFVASNDQIRP